MAFDCTNSLGWIVQSRAVSAGESWDAAYTNCTVVDSRTVPATAGNLYFRCVPLAVVGWTCERVLQIKVRRVPPGSISSNADGKAKLMTAYIQLT